MMYYAAKAIEKLGDSKTAGERFQAFLDYADAHRNDNVKIEYFAVSLPDFLIFHADLDKKNKVNCFFMAALGYLGQGDKENAEQCAKKGLELDNCHEGLTYILKELK